LHDTRTPVIVGTIAMSLNIVFSFAFSALFSSIGWMPHGGLALANSFATALEMSALFILMRRRLKGLDDMNIGRGLLQAVFATLVMSLALWGWLQFTSGFSVWIIAPIGIIAGGIIYIAIMFMLRVPELNELVWVIKRRLGQRG
jgi:putative peptidoglycan lipid II flippase